MKDKNNDDANIIFLIPLIALLAWFGWNFLLFMFRRVVAQF